MSIVNLDKSLGSLRCVASNELIEYEPYEFSQRCIGILSPIPMVLGSVLVLDSHRNGDLCFKIANKQRQGDLFRYRLVLDMDGNLAKQLDIDTRSGKLKYERQNNRLQYARFTIEPQFYVYTRTFGSTDNYVLKGVDVSKSGILLCAPKPYGVIPFIEQTLLEIKLDLGSKLSSQSIEPLGKVVRIYSEGLGNQRIKYIGVKFVDFASNDWEAWNKALETIEKTSIADIHQIAA